LTQTLLRIQLDIFRKLQKVSFGCHVQDCYDQFAFEKKNTDIDLLLYQSCAVGVLKLFQTRLPKIGSPSNAARTERGVAPSQHSARPNEF